MTRRTIVFLHPSDELYGADRVLLDTLDALPDDVSAQVWLPTDLTHPATPLCAEIELKIMSSSCLRNPTPNIGELNHSLSASPHALSRPVAPLCRPRRGSLMRRMSLRMR